MGVVFQDSNMSSYAVAVRPVPVINHFIEDYDKNGAYTGKYMYTWGNGFSSSNF